MRVGSFFSVMTKSLFVLLVMLIILSCKSRVTQTHLLNFKQFTIETPAAWTKVVCDSGDKRFGGIEMDSADFVHFSYGFDVGDLEDYVKNPADTTTLYIIYPPLSELGKNRNSEAGHETIDRKSAKIVFPIVPGVGVTGLFIDSVKTFNGRNMQFEMSGNNLKPKNEKAFLLALKTLKFAD
ncbi:MAG: hypothetical protein JWQ27_2168 [Ferruginibacter sp.]|nr:hypothetical protein [Ferruginibacter sp.]